MNNSNSSHYKSIHLVELAKEAIDFIIYNKKKIINSIKYPCVFTIISSFFVSPDSENMDLTWALTAAIQTYLYILIVVRIHRIFLIDETEYSLKGAFLWRNNNTSYLLTTMAIGAITIFIIPPVLIISSIMSGHEKTFAIIAAIPIGYIIARFSLVLPSIAINDKIDFGESWNISKGQGWKVFILITLLPILFNNGIELIYYENIVFRPIFSLLKMLILIFEVIILSNTYKTLMD